MTRKNRGDTSKESMRSQAWLHLLRSNPKTRSWKLGELQWLNITNFVAVAQKSFDSVRTILGLDIWFIAYLTQIFIFSYFPVQSNPRQLIGATFSSHLDPNHIYRIQASTRIGNVQTMHWEYMIFNILSMKSSDSNTNMMHQAGWWSLGKLCLGDSIFQI